MNKKYNEVVIVAAVRTPIGTYKGSLKNIKADELGSIVIKEVLRRSKINSNEINEVILGQVLTSATGQNPARQASINAGLPNFIPSYLVNQVCGSGLRSVILAFQTIKLEEAKYIISGGQENMSIAPHALLYRNDKKLLENKLIDTMTYDGLIDAFNKYHMGVTAENVAEKFQISREEQDNFALKSQNKTKLAQEQNKFEDELVKVNESGKYLDADEHPRKNLRIEDLRKLKTVFKDNGTVTAGNSSGINDGAAAVLLTSLEEAKKRSLKPLVKIVSWSSVGVEPSLMGLAPIDAVKSALKKANWKIDDVDLFEINEAFAAQSIAVIKELNINETKVNINGGAIALGHPIGASGTRILVTLIHEMQRQNKTKGCATLCIGGGMGIAICIEKI
jgi:acetyl-CoA C-acetyltransferase|tara:strand:- start:1849 stop:3024 length:1176 start_codon:yes stop_codon:yes gene_type:complete